MIGYSERARFERYRLMVISTWPDSDLKAAALASARAALQRELYEQRLQVRGRRAELKAAA